MTRKTSKPVSTLNGVETGLLRYGTKRMTHENISTAQSMAQTGKGSRQHGEESETTETAGVDERTVRDGICEVLGKR